MVTQGEPIEYPAAIFDKDPGLCACDDPQECPWCAEAVQEEDDA